MDRASVARNTWGRWSVDWINLQTLETHFFWESRCVKPIWFLGVLKLCTSKLVLPLLQHTTLALNTVGKVTVIFLRLGTNHLHSCFFSFLFFVHLHERKQNDQAQWLLFWVSHDLLLLGTFCSGLPDDLHATDVLFYESMNQSFSI